MCCLGFGSEDSFKRVILSVSSQKENSFLLRIHLLRSITTKKRSCLFFPRSEISRKLPFFAFIQYAITAANSLFIIVVEKVNRH